MKQRRSSSLRMARRLFSLALPHWRAYSVVCGAGLVIAGLEMIPPKLVGRAIDQMSQSTFEIEPIIKMAGLWALIAVVVQLLHGLQIYLANKYGEIALSTLRQKIFNHLQKLSMGFYD